MQLEVGQVGKQRPLTFIAIIKRDRLISNS